MAENRLLRLPLELLQMVASHLDDTASISKLCRSNRHFYDSLGGYLYRYDAVLASEDRRCKALLATVAESTLDTDTRVSIARKSLEAGADANSCVDVWFKWFPVLGPVVQYCEEHECGSILHAAVARGCLPLVQVLVDFKADINRLTEGRKVPPIAIAMLKPWTDGFLFLLDLPTIDLSGSEKGHVNFGSVIHIAVFYGRIDFAEKLLRYVDPLVDDGPWAPLLWLAVDRNNSAMLSFLLSCEKVKVNAVQAVGYMRTAWPEMWKRESTVFVWTCRYETLEMMKLLHDHRRVDVDLCDKHNEYPPARAAMESREKPELKIDFLIKSSKCRTARDYVFRVACERGNMELAHKVVRLAEDHDKKHAKDWISKAELHNIHGLERSIRKKWRDV